MLQQFRERKVPRENWNVCFGFCLIFSFSIVKHSWSHLARTLKHWISLSQSIKLLFSQSEQLYIRKLDPTNKILTGLLIQFSYAGHQPESKFTQSKVKFFIFFNSFIEAYFTYHEIHPFKIYKSVPFSNFTEQHNHHHKSVLEYFHPPYKISPAYLQLDLILPPVPGNH